MKKYLFLILIIIAFFPAFAYAQHEAHDRVLANIREHYNNADYDYIYQLLTEDMQKAMPLEKMTTFFTGLKSNSGELLKTSFVKYNAPVAGYVGFFKNDTLSIGIGLDNNRINWLQFNKITKEDIPTMERNVTRMSLPFKGEWRVVWGGDTEELNYHIVNRAQKNAMDFVVTDENGKTHKTDGIHNEDYYAWGKEIHIPCDGTVIMAVDGVVDNVPGEMDPYMALGNMVVVRTNDNEYIFFAHFKNGSVKVKQGDKIKAGHLLGLCGNSGNSSEPHLHFHLQNTDKLAKATGIKCFFREIVVNGEKRTDYSPLRGDRVSNP